MSLVTHCPECATTFRVSPAQLSARGGRVRCGRCARIFDGVASLLTEEAIAALPDEPSPQLGLFEPRQPASAPTPTEEVRIAPADIALPVAQVLDPSSLDYANPTEPPSALEPQPEPRIEPQPAPRLESQPEFKPDADAPLPAFLAPAKSRSQYHLLWSLFSLLALVALGIQAALHFRTEIAVLLPEARSYMATACDVLGCDLRLPRRAEMMSIESSDLQADPRRPGVIVLNALLRNRAPFSQEFPDLELTLTDRGDQPVIRRVLSPGDYLQKKRLTRAQGIAGGAEESVRVYFDTRGIAATGYQLFLFYPCPPPGTSLYWQLSYPARCQGSRNR